MSLLTGLGDSSTVESEPVISPSLTGERLVHEDSGGQFGDLSPANLGLQLGSHPPASQTQTRRPWGGGQAGRPRRPPSGPHLERGGTCDRLLLSDIRRGEGPVTARPHGHRSADALSLPLSAQPGCDPPQERDSPSRRHALAGHRNKHRSNQPRQKNPTEPMNTHQNSRKSTLFLWNLKLLSVLPPQGNESGQKSYCWGLGIHLPPPPSLRCGLPQPGADGSRPPFKHRAPALCLVS